MAIERGRSAACATSTDGLHHDLRPERYIQCGGNLPLQPVAVEGRGFFARCLQHETDHLDGLLYLDRLIGRHKRAGRRAVRARGWGEPGHSWDPALQRAQEV